ncbi:hypothetical protein CISIN_1g047464mg, partial [Citrus sinensis]
MLTVSRLQPSTVDIKTLQRRNAAVGCNGNSFIIRYLINVLNFKPGSNKKINAKNGYNSITSYPMAFESGDIAAAFLVFPRGSPLALDISEAILK